MADLTTKPFDTIVIGAGLSGLSASLFLQKHGQRVLLIERRGVPGGLCGTGIVDGYEFAIGCNDFGQGLVKMVRELGVPLQFKTSKALIYHRGQAFTFPPDFKTSLKLLPYSLDFYRMFRAYRKTTQSGETKTLGKIVSESVRDQRAADLLNFFAFAACLPPRQCGLEFITHEKTYQYGYSRMMIPSGGPRAMAEALATKFLQHGHIMLSTEVHETEKEGAVMAVHTGRGTFRAQHVISTLERKDLHPQDARSGLSLSFLFLALKKTFPYPEVHSRTHYPPGIDGWFSSLEVGDMPDQFAFNLVRTELPEEQDYHSLTAYFFLPRGMDSPDARLRTQAEDYILGHAERMLPGLRKNVIYRRLVGPLEYRQRFSLSSKAMAIIPPRSYQRPQPYDPQSGIHYAGHSAFPPGDHAGAAFLSGRYAASSVLASQSSSSRAQSNQLLTPARVDSSVRTA